MDELINQTEGSLYLGLGLEAGRPANLAASVELRREHRPATVSHASSAYNVRKTLVDPGGLEPPPDRYERGSYPGRSRRSRHLGDCLKVIVHVWCAHFIGRPLAGWSDRRISSVALRGPGLNPCPSKGADARRSSHGLFRLALLLRNSGVGDHLLPFRNLRHDEVSHLVR